MRSLFWSLTAVGALALFVLAGPSLQPAAAADEASWGYAIAHELMSPFCPGRTLAACSSPQAAELRQWIVLQEVSGATRAEVEAELFERFGQIIKSTPKPEGWGLAARLLPFVALVLGAGLVYVVLRRIVAPGEGALPAAQTSTGPAAVDPELERQLEEELRALDL